MKPTLIRSALRTTIATKRPAFIHGSPGVGKSQVVRAVAEDMRLALRDVRVSLLDPVDLRGLPFEDNGIAKWASPDFLPRVERDGEKGILFLDELSAAAPSVQVAAYQLVLERRLGEYALPAGWAIVAAGNKSTDRAVVQKMSKALANRFSHFEFEVDLNDWIDWALDANMPEEVIAFIRWRPELLHAFDPADPSPAFASPRSWEYVGSYVADGPDPAVEAELYRGTIGEKAATEFVGFLRVFRSLPDPAGVLLNPDTAPVPDDPATLYALCGALSRLASKDNFDRVTAYGSRLPAEFSVLLVQDAAKRKPEVQSTRAFIKWAAANRDVLI